MRWTPRAQHELREADRWWATHRPAAPSLLRREARFAAALLSRYPMIGVEVGEAAMAGVRCLRLTVSRYTLWYRTRDGGNEVQVVALWHARRDPPRAESLP